ncbi:MAG TPA: hypothetical protein PLA01_04390 [Acetivibrio sp.]|nr:hypothetical protein [Acetivibrio sp.]
MSNQLPFTISLLSSEYLSLLSNFRCGNEEIDRYIKEDALNDKESGKGVTYLVLNNEKNKLIAYYTLAATSVIYSETKDITAKRNIEEVKIRGFPAIEIKMFAVSKSYQNYTYYSKEFGPKILSDMILGAVIGDIYNYATERLGIRMIILYSTEEGFKFYKRNNFEELESYIPLYSEYTKDCIPMYLRLFD